MKLDDVMKLQHFVDILTAVHMCIILYCPLSIWAKEKSLSDPKPQTAWSKRGATRSSRGQNPLGHVASLSSHIKLWKAGFTDPDSCILLFC